jgi:murein DD-endopeptidase MepM/ murein hydrolase activator NlpD
MIARRYTVVIADRSTGVLRHVTVKLRSIAALVAFTLLLPVLIGLGAKWSARLEIDQLRSAKAALEVENGSYRAATGELTTQIQSLETVINDLGARSQLDPAQSRAMQKLPAVVRTRAAGGANVPANAAIAEAARAAMSTPEDTFGVLRDLLQGLENRLRHVRRDVERREELASSTPSIWPAHGWLTGTFGGRSDPFSGEPAFHQGIDISTEKGQPVYATADGTVESASYTGDYGNLIVLRHGFGLATRYGHLSAFAVKPGHEVRRGDVIGYVGSTGRSTGAHLHYEILANGKLINPLQLLTQPTDH